MDDQQNSQPMMLADESDASSLEFKLVTVFGYVVSGLVVLCVLAAMAMVIGLAILTAGSDW